MEIIYNQFSPNDQYDHYVQYDKYDHYNHSREIELFKSEMYHGGEKSERSKLCKIIESDNKSKLEKYIEEKNVSFLEFNIDSENSGYGFDILTYAIKKKVSTKIIKYIVKNGPYLDFNYGCMENSTTFSVPLFVALANNEYETANFLIENHADIHYIYRYQIDKVHEDDISYIRKDFKYCETLDQDSETLDYYRNVKANVIEYLCEVERLNPKNLNYLILKGYDLTKLSKDFLDKLKSYKKDRYIDMLNTAIKKLLLKSN